MDWQALFGARGRTAVITGGSGQLGEAMASALARGGRAGGYPRAQYGGGEYGS